MSQIPRGMRKGYELTNMIGKKIPSILSEVDKWAANGVKFIYP